MFQVTSDDLDAVVSERTRPQDAATGIAEGDESEVSFLLLFHCFGVPRYLSK